jgi:hypothetical protein
MFNEIECTQNIQLKRTTAYLVEYMLRTQIPRDNSFFEEDACTQTEHTNRWDWKDNNFLSQPIVRWPL